MRSKLEKTSLRLGLLPLADAAPLVIAKSQGFFARHGLDVELSVERAWAALRDKVAAGVLDGGQMLAPMPIAATLGLDGVAVPMVTALTLSLNGNAIIVSRSLHERLAGFLDGPATASSSAAALARLIACDSAQGKRRLVFAHVFPFSAHHYELRMWLASANIDPDSDVQLCVVPPSQMVQELEAGRVDGYCVGEPWNEVARQRGIGMTVATKHEIWNNSPEKVLGVTREWAYTHPNTHRALVAALIETARWLDRPENRAAAAEQMIADQIINAPASALKAVLEVRSGGIVFHRGAATFPWRSHAVWFILQMLRWRQCWMAPNFNSIAAEVYRCELYRDVAASIDEPCPRNDYKTEGDGRDGSVMPSSDGRLIRLGPDAMLDGSVFDPVDPIGWLTRQTLGMPAVGQASLRLANVLS